MIVTSVHSENGKFAAALLVGANARQAEDLRSVAGAEDVRIETAGSAAELAGFDLSNIGVILAWDEGEAIELLLRQFAAMDCRLPVVAIGEHATVRQVVRAMNCGVADYIDWPGEAHLLRSAIQTANEASKRPRPPAARRGRAHHALSRLSPRERQVLGLMAEGMTNKLIARSLKISPRTVEIHRANMLEKLKSKSSAGAIRLFLEATVPAQIQAEEAAHRSARGDGQAVIEIMAAADVQMQALQDDS